MFFRWCTGRREPAGGGGWCEWPRHVCVGPEQVSPQEDHRDQGQWLLRQKHPPLEPYSPSPQETPTLRTLLSLPARNIHPRALLGLELSQPKPTPKAPPLIDYSLAEPRILLAGTTLDSPLIFNIPQLSLGFSPLAMFIGSFLCQPALALLELITSTSSENYKLENSARTNKGIRWTSSEFTSDWLGKSFSSSGSSLERGILMCTNCFVKQDVIDSAGL